mgnify:CR=1 FL=1
MSHKKRLLIAYVIVFGLYLILYYNKTNDDLTTDSVVINKEKVKPYIMKENKVETNKYSIELPAKRRFGYKLGDNLNIVLTPSLRNKDDSANHGAIIKLELLF